MKRIYLVLTASALVFGLVGNAKGFSYNNFSSTAGLTFVGNTQKNGNSLILTDGLYKTSAVWYGTRQSVQNGFETTFEFHGMADGVAFVIQDYSGTALGNSGQYMGYNFANSLAVEMDGYHNGSWDPEYSHTSIQTRGKTTNSADMLYSLGYAKLMQDGLVKVSYVPGTMKIFVNNMSSPLITASVNLGSLLNLNNGKAWVGFTGSSGDAYNTQSLSSWTFVTPEPATLALLGLGGLLLRRK